MFREDWVKVVEDVVKELSRKFRVEAAIVFGSWTRSGGGEWSDVDLLVITDDVRSVNPLDRFYISVEFRRYGVDLFLYTYDEFERMCLKGNPLTLSALLEGLYIVSNEKVLTLRDRLYSKYRRDGRVWIRLE